MDNMDGITREIENRTGTTGLVSWFLAASILYYHCDTSILSDARYDEIAKLLLADYDNLKSQHAPLLLKEDLKAGTLYALSWRNYPLMVRSMASHVLTPAMKAKLTDEARVILNSNDFCPPEYSWDTFVYGSNGMTYRTYQKEMVAQWDGMIKKGHLTVEQKREFCQKIGVKVTMAAPPPPPAPRVRMRPAEITQQIVRPRVRVIQ